MLKDEFKSEFVNQFSLAKEKKKNHESSPEFKNINDLETTKKIYNIKNIRP